MFATIDSTSKMTAVEAAGLRVATILMPCGGLLHFDSAEFGPEVGEVSIFSGSERYIFHTDESVEVVRWEGGR